MNLLLIAARNALRNPFRTTLTIVGSAVAVLAFMMLRTVISAWYVGVDNAARDRLATWHKVTFIMPMPKHYVDQVRGVPGVKATTFANWFGAKDPRHPDDFFANMAVDPATFLDVYDEMVVTPDDKARWIADRKGAIVGDVLAKKLGVKVGDTITLQGSIYPGDWQFNITAIYSASRKSVDRSQFIFHFDYLNESLPPARRDLVGWISSRVDDPAKGADVAAAIDRLFDDRDTQTQTQSERAMQNSFMATLSAILTALNIVSVIILIIMMMILGNTIAMGVRERTTEYGVLRAIGFSPGHIRTFVLGEAVTLGLLAGLVGVAISFPIVEWGMGRFLEENFGAWFPYFRIDRLTAVAGVLLAVALSVVAATLPAHGAAKLKVVDALRRVA